MLIKNAKPLCAISYDTKTFEIVSRFLREENSANILKRVDPREFLLNPDNKYQYVNLVVNDFVEREAISNMLDSEHLDRFTYLSENLSMHKYTEFDLGCIIYPGVFAYSANIGKDCLIHGRVYLAEDIKIGQGCFLSGSVNIAGSSSIGNYCYISTNVTIMDHVHVCDRVKLLPGVTIKKDLIESGTFYNPNVFTLRKFD